MSMEAMKQHGAFSWNELATPDVASAKSFYSSLLGWKFKDVDNSPMPYMIAETGDTEVAGIMETPKEAVGMPPMWGGYVTVDDVDERTKRAQELGASIYVEPRDIPKVGRFAVIADPQGAMLSMITYSK
ncbi:MAG: VOC family protein [Gammaproteobacteria bacterium]|nr:VOC family protein [Gammaproteobacteria bacterium]